MTHLKNLRRMALVAAVALTMAPAFLGTAMADDHGHPGPGDRDWRAHEVAARHWHRVHPVPVEHVVYAPPAVVMAPPPPPEPSGINLIIPLNIH